MIDHEIFQRSELLVQNIIEIIDLPAYGNSARIAVSGNLCQMSIEHSCAFRSLAESRMFASSFVVLRAQFESAVRALWAHYSASDHQISRVSAHLNPESEQSAKNLPGVEAMLDSLETVPNAKVPFNALAEFKDSAWRALNSYTHGGIHPLNRLATGYPMELIIANVKVSNALAMITAMQFCILTGVDGLQKQLNPLIERFDDCFPAHRVGA
ncbi:MAG TPA: hypothetical protein VNI56_01020 [Xanthomonadaceae bacterium]|nr:hypothetical protein [Xanthomonadaceae bacterium]